MIIAILDYGIGNLFSIRRSVEREGGNVILSKGLSEGFDGLILPGVGNFKAVHAKVFTLRDRLLELASSGMPILGICLGMHVLLDGSDEAKGNGLGVFPGRAVRFPEGLKVPHIGWNTIELRSYHDILDGIESSSWAYFVHSYCPKLGDEGYILAETEYGIRFPSVVARKNVVGTQFHPEKSSTTGSKIIRNFIGMCRR